MTPEPHNLRMTDECTRSPASGLPRHSQLIRRTLGRRNRPLLVTLGTLWTSRVEAYTTAPARANLRRALLEAVLWSDSRADPSAPGSCLRSELLRPYIFNESRHDTVYDVACARHAGLERDDVIAPRGGRSEELLEAAEVGLSHAIAVVKRGRLLVWHRDETIDDGAGEAATSGYLDESDMPPWDTWVAYVDADRCSGYLVSWVPPIFIGAVARAIAINAYGALYWLNGTTLLLAGVLEQDGLLV